MWFRTGLIISAAALLSVALWMATHVSKTPNILGRWSSGYAMALFGLLFVSVVLGLLGGPLYRYVHSWRHNVALLAITSVLSLAGLELAVRWLDLFGISYYADNERYHRAKLPDPDLYYVHPPNTAFEFRDFSARINSLGMRGNEVSAKQDGEYRVLFLGDSVLFGWGVEEDDAFAETVGPLLSNRLGRNVRTLNSGVGSYNTDNQWGFLDRHGDALDPDFVALIYAVNDFERTPSTPFDPLEGARPREMSPPQLIGWLLGKSWIYRSIVHFRRYGQRAGAEVPIQELRRSEGWRASSSALEKIAQWCQARNIPFALYLIRIVDDPIGRALNPLLNEVGAEHGFPVFDTRFWFEDENPRDIINSAVDSHPNAAGHAVLAEGIADSMAGIAR
jgi:lysophospholipase L1-like esterase